MISRRASRVTATLAMSLCLNGCVAAAIPVLAGAGIVRAETDGKDAGPAEPEPTVAQASMASESDAQPALAATVSPAPAPMTTTEPPSQPKTVLSAGSLPANVFIGPAPASDDAMPKVEPPSPYAPFFEYAKEQKLEMADPTPTMSAMLRDPSALDGKRRECRTSIPVVLIDLDPKDNKLVAEEAADAPPALVAGLQALRDEEIDIAWISEQSIARAQTIRDTLIGTGLDPDGEDRVILMRNRNDRKQTRRQELVRESCVLAIAGDNRADFDELFDYLVNPEAAAGLELLIGEGWFLVPPVLLGDK